MGNQPLRGFKIGIFGFRTKPIGSLVCHPGPRLRETHLLTHANGSHLHGGRERDGGEERGMKSSLRDDAKSFEDRNASQPVSDDF